MAVLFSEAAMNKTSRTEARMITEIAKAITATNTAFNNSDINLVVEPVFVGKVRAVELGSSCFSVHLGRSWNLISRFVLPVSPVFILNRPYMFESQPASTTWCCVIRSLLHGVYPKPGDGDLTFRLLRYRKNVFTSELFMSSLHLIPFSSLFLYTLGPFLEVS